jgi:adenylyltransferase/sulfurtransferase
MHADFTEAETQRYARHILLREVGGVGQAKLRAASVLLVGAGGLGSPVLLYLAAAGIGRIGIIDDDVVELSNLQRQIAHQTQSLGEPKVASAARSALAINPESMIEPHQLRLDPTNAMDLIGSYDLVCDGTDNFATRLLVSDACVLAKKTLVSAAVTRFDGQLATFRPHLAGPCYRCLVPEAPPPGLIPSCSEAGVFGAVVGVMGSLQATEAIKEILGIGETLAGSLLIYEALAARFHTIHLPKDPRCPSCGASPAWHDLSHHPTPGGGVCAR